MTKALVEQPRLIRQKYYPNNFYQILKDFLISFSLNLCFFDQYGQMLGWTLRLADNKGYYNKISILNYENWYFYKWKYVDIRIKVY